jgi:hypothetical protein
MATLFLRFSRRRAFADFVLDEKKRVFHDVKSFLICPVAYLFVWKIETGLTGK